MSSNRGLTSGPQDPPMMTPQHYQLYTNDGFLQGADLYSAEGFGQTENRVPIYQYPMHEMVNENGEITLIVPPNLDYEKIKEIIFTPGNDGLTCITLEALRMRIQTYKGY